jgi:hypothetical protein
LIRTLVVAGGGGGKGSGSAGGAPSDATTGAATFGSGGLRAPLPEAHPARTATNTTLDQPSFTTAGSLPETPTQGKRHAFMGAKNQSFPHSNLDFSHA